jgi:hypothetical protein
MSETLEVSAAYAEIIEPRLRAVSALCRRLDVTRLDVFGSVVTEQFDPQRSDLDFLVAFAPLPPGQYATACFELRTGLERLFGRRIDLLTEAALANPYLRRQIESEKRCLYPPP